MSDHGPNRSRFDLVGPLWALAAGLLVVAIGRALPPGLPAPSVADGQVVSTVGDITVLTASRGNDQDVLAVLDQRAGMMLIYEANPRRNLELMQAVPIEDLFDQARADAPARR